MALKLLSAFKIEFQCYFHKVFDIADLKNNFHIWLGLKMSFQALSLLNLLLDPVLKIQAFLKNLTVFSALRLFSA